MMDGCVKNDGCVKIQPWEKSSHLPAALVDSELAVQPSGTLVPYDFTYYITLSFTVYDIIYDKSSL